MAFDGHISFKGIPFAQPPVGSLRWAHPLPKQPWRGVINATEFSNGCIQTCHLPPHVCPQNVSEDCLYLNIFAPRGGSSAPKPVMFFLAGGGFFQGAAGVVLYDGRFIANASDVIVVTANYRLGALGFFSYSNYNGESLSGNFGLLDQVLALQWVQANIGAFGGDASNVVAFGQSAGAMSIGLHLINPHLWAHGTTALFRGAIMESNPLGLPYKTCKEQEEWGGNFAEHLGCSDLACMMAASASEVRAAQLATFVLDLDAPLDMALLWSPCVDGDTFPMPPILAFEKGLAQPMPIVIGTTADEGLLFVREALKSIDTIEYFGILIGVFGIGNAWDVDDQYPASSTKNADKSYLMERLITDDVFWCATRRAARALGASGAPVWMYRFTRVLSINTFVWGNDFAYCDAYVCHGEELPVLFNVPQLLGLNFTAGEVALVDSMQRLWSNFAKSLSPNAPAKGALPWPLAGVNASTNMVFDVPQSVQSDFNAAKCDFWETIEYKRL
jgi:carboxylesterase type B